MRFSLSGWRRCATWILGVTMCGALWAQEAADSPMPYDADASALLLARRYLQGGEDARTAVIEALSEMQLRDHARKLLESFEDLRELEADRQSMTQLTVHDLRTPLTSLTMGLEMLPQLGSLNVEQHQALNLLRRGSEVLRKLVDDLLDIGSVSQRGRAALCCRSCVPGNLITAAIEQIATLASSKQIEVKNEWVAGTTAVLMVDEDKVTRVLVNLLGNALKFTPAGGTVRIFANNDGESLEGRPGVSFSVADSGIGIAPENQARIFEQGVKLDAASPTSKSAGLGLTFCKRIVAAHGGIIRLRSEVGKGSCFQFVLPITGEPKK